MGGREKGRKCCSVGYWHKGKTKEGWRKLSKEGWREGWMVYVQDVVGVKKEFGKSLRKGCISWRV